MGKATDKKAEKKASKKADKKAAKSPAKPAAAQETTPAKAKPLSSREILAKANSKSKPSKKDESSSEESSESEPEDEKSAPKANDKTKASEPAKTTTARTNGKVKGKANEASSSGEASSSESESEDEKPKAAQVKVTPNKVASSSSSSSESSSEEETPKKVAPVAKTATPAKAPAKPATSSSEESDSDESSSEDEAPKKPAAIPTPVKATPAKAAPPSSGESDSDEESSSEEEDAPKKVQQKAAPAKTTPVKEPESEDEDSSDESSEDEDVKMADESTKPSKGKRKADDEASAPAKKTKVANGDAVATDGSEPIMTIFVGRLSWNVDNDWLAQEFAECGEVVEARVQMDRNTGKSRGFAYVTFATAEAVEAALQLNGKEIDGRPVNIDKSTPKPPAERRDARAKAFGDTQGPPSTVLFVGSLSWDATEDMLWETFTEYGEVKSVRVPTDRETGRPKGFGYIEFSDVDSATKALEGAAGTEIAGRAIRLDYSERRDGGATRGFGDRGGRGRGRVCCRS
ncbi:hypothetical protein DAEQUDRAFT_758403 [Daedalea quercina L-15889]|uniref:RRM domain-containing protein n=1 Tax=Daedalea quercina L-15889 TaxID=1314783 RepID=A0A165NHR0_9APHY|nr:hypothetical protein DAEQUDRAFT_758403 [Daedalea quercina L-15889]